MKKNIHPNYNHNTKVTCSCGNTFLTGSILESIQTELCSKCHPFYTGEQRIVDTENRVAKFEEKRSKAKSSFRSKKQKMASRKLKISEIDKRNETAGLTLKDMLTGLGTDTKK
jgi:large subunit ribosomal protein L31